jgi:hypothetical protein
VPIRPENRGRYPANWREISFRIRFERAGGRCECVGECGLEHEGGRCAAEHGKPNPATSSRVVLTAAHRHGRPIEDCSDEALFAACQLCHNRYDAPVRAAGRKERARALIRRTTDRMRFEIECATGRPFAR